MDNKAQGALEYLLLIGGAVLIAAIVIVILTSFAGPGDTTNAKNTFHTKWENLYHEGGL
jgi:uncharacterized protein (UPF0333 family)